MPLTNEQMVKNLMNYSKYGPMGQVFIMIAIEDYAKMVLEQGPAVDNNKSIISPLLWDNIAHDVLDRLNEMRARK